jgi:hypothetical protein
MIGSSRLVYHAYLMDLFFYFLKFKVYCYGIKSLRFTGMGCSHRCKAIYFWGSWSACIFCMPSSQRKYSGNPLYPCMNIHQISKLRGTTNEKIDMKKEILCKKQWYKHKKSNYAVTFEIAILFKFQHVQGIDKVLWVINQLVSLCTFMI